MERPVLDGRYWQHSYGDHMARYLFAAGFCRGKRVLDIGCGPGYGAKVFLAEGAKDVTGSDISEDAITQARQNCGADDAVFVVDDSEKLTHVTGRYDVICSLEHLEHLAKPEALLSQSTMLLGPGGVLIISVPDKIAEERLEAPNPYHIHRWSPDELAELLGRYYAEVVLHAQVQSHSAVARWEATSNLDAHLRYLWNSPLRRVGRWVSRVLFGRSMEWPDITGLRAPSTGDYPIVSSQIAHLLGRPYCIVCECRQPRTG